MASKAEEVVMAPTRCVSTGRGKGYCQWGHQKKYKFSTKAGKSSAMAKANRQGRAIRATGWGE
jgi:hypothetical protein